MALPAAATAADTAVVREMSLSDAEEGGRTTVVASAGEADEGYETAGKKELLPSRGHCKETRKSKSPRPISKEGEEDYEAAGAATAETQHAGEGEEGGDVVERLIRSMEEQIDRDSLTDEAIELLRLVPTGYIPLPHQVGGHRHIDGKPGFLRRLGQPKVLFKPVQGGVKGVREVSFYDVLHGVESGLGQPDMFPGLTESVQQSEEQVRVLKDILPQYYGLESIADRSGKSTDYLKLEDITHQFDKACIMDLKLGQRVWDDFAEQDKIEREKKKYPSQEVLGFRIIGMRVYRASTDDYVFYDRYFGRSVTVDRALEALSRFFDTGTGVRRSDIIAVMLSRLGRFLEWMEHQSSLRLFATSLLVVYEGSPSCSSPTLDMRLVDFAHTYERTEEDITPDGNAVYGLRNFIDFLRQL